MMTWRLLERGDSLKVKTDGSKIKFYLWVEFLWQN
jgi:hypothetical protein